MTREAHYARHSSDLQNQRSTCDQLAALRLAGEAAGATVIQTFRDQAISGSSMLNRPGLRDLMAAVARGEIDRVRVEALDRLSRDVEDTAHIFKRLTYAGVELVTQSEGRITELHVGLTATMNQLFLVELGKKTRRGLVARVKAGASGGGRCYGYDLGAATGELLVNDRQAEIVNEIFERYAAGDSPRTIAHDLNSRGQPGPRGGTWSPSSIYGDRRAQDGILSQELYVGTRIYNRRRYRKNPDTGRRSSVLNPQNEWLREPTPDLQIISDDLWKRVQDRKAAMSAQPAAYARKPKRLLSGLMKCSLCGSGMTLNGGKYACSAARERGTCRNTKIIAATTVERRVLAGLKKHLVSPEAIAVALDQYRAAAAEQARVVARDRAPLERELAQVSRQLERIQTLFIEEEIDLDECKSKSNPLKARQQELQTLLSSSPTPETLEINPSVADTYRELAENLTATIDGAGGEALRAELRKLIDRVDFIPLEGLGKFDLRVHGSLAVLLGLRGDENAENPAASGSGVLEGSHACEVSLGAGVGFEPTTFRL